MDATIRLTIVTMGVGVALACGGGPPAPPPPPPPPAPEEAAVRVVATLSEPDVVVLEAATDDGWWAATSSGGVWRLREGRPPERVVAVPGGVEAFAVSDRLYAGTVGGLWSSALDGRDTRTEASDPVVAVAAVRGGACAATVVTIRCPELRIDGVHILFPDELAADERFVAWVDHGAGEVWAAERATGARVRVGSGRGPHGLSLDAGSLFWRESEADLLPGRAATATRARSTLAGWQLDPVVLDAWGGPRLRDGRLYAPGACADPSAAAWPFQLAGEPPVAVGAANFGWVRHEPSGSVVVVAAPRSLCAG